jgi:threonine aldolase
VETNIIFFELESVNAFDFAEKLRQHSILVEAVESNLIRVVANLMVDDRQIRGLLGIIETEMKKTS